MMPPPTRQTLVASLLLLALSTTALWPAHTNSAATGGKVRQGGTELDIDLEGGKILTIQIAEATSSVMLRDKAGKLEYAD